MILSASLHALAKHTASFYLPWIAAAVVAAQEPKAAATVTMISVQGLEIPALQLVLAVAGVLMARPLTPRREPPLGMVKSVLVTAIMLVAAAAWVADSRPGVLFTFVVSIGLGFSGFTLIEIAGREIETFFKRLFALATGTLDRISGKDK